MSSIMHALFFSLLGLRTFFSRIIFLVGKDLFSYAADLPTIGCSPLKQEVWVAFSKPMWLCTIALHVFFNI